MRSPTIGAITTCVVLATPSVVVAAPVPQPTHKDRTFLAAAARGGWFEVIGGRLAVARGSDARVRAFGARMIVDHGRGAAALARLAHRLGVPVPTRPDVNQRRILAIWSTLRGGSFDCSYAPAAFADHSGDVAVFQNEAEHGDDPRVRAFAWAQLPTLHRHRQLAAESLPQLRC